MDIRDVKDRRTYLGRLQKLAMSALIKDQNFVNFIHTADPSLISVLQSGIGQWVQWARKIPDTKTEADVLKVIRFVSEFASESKSYDNDNADDT